MSTIQLAERRPFQHFEDLCKAQNWPKDTITAQPLLNGCLVTFKPTDDGYIAVNRKGVVYKGGVVQHVASLFRVAGLPRVPFEATVTINGEAGSGSSRVVTNALHYARCYQRGSVKVSVYDENIVLPDDPLFQGVESIVVADRAQLIRTNYIFADAGHKGIVVNRVNPSAGIHQRYTRSTRAVSYLVVSAIDRDASGVTGLWVDGVVCKRMVRQFIDLRGQTALKQEIDEAGQQFLNRVIAIEYHRLSKIQHNRAGLIKPVIKYLSVNSSVIEQPNRSLILLH